jgi:predicted 2-oxoglutarate/Fe(II)-dependent dioxygenase YbiX
MSSEKSLRNPISHLKRHSSARCISPMKIIGAFSPDECDRIVELTEGESFMSGEMRNPLEGYRNCQISIIHSSSSSAWLATKLTAIMETANETYGFEMGSSPPTLQFTRYGIGGKIDWHTDFDFNLDVSRKISISVQLTPRQQYSGGGLEFFPTGEMQLGRDQGTAIVFPSFFTHAVMPVTEGVRESLVVWFYGPNFR